MKHALALVLSVLLMAWLFCSHAIAESELEACKRLAPKYRAKIEVRLDDGTRVDLLSAEYAIEVDWAMPGKHFEAVGQALYYSILTDRKPAIILLVFDKRGEIFVARTRVVCEKAGIKLYTEAAVKTVKKRKGVPRDAK